MKAFIAVVLLAAVAHAQLDPLGLARGKFADWKAKSKEEKRAFAKDLLSQCKWSGLNADEVASNLDGQAEEEDPTAEHQKGVTCMSAFSRSQFKSTFLTAKVPAEAKGRPAFFGRQKRQTLPASVDWSTQGYVTPVQDQGQCGSCWTFSAAGAMEGALYKKNKVLPNISEQNFVDCVKSPYTSAGCNGGWMTDAYRYSNDTKGVNGDSTYPYKAAQQTCAYKSASNVGYVNGYKYTNADDEADLKAKLATVGPIAVAMDASGIQSYTGGVYKCTNYTDVNHGVLLVGYGTDSTLGDYWKIKNSWGTGWGEKGYIRIKRNAGYAAACGVPSYANYPTIA